VNKFTPPTPESNPRIIRRAELLKIVGLCYHTIWAAEKKGQFPARVKLGARAVGWYHHEVLAWLENRRIPTPPQEATQATV